MLSDEKYKRAITRNLDELANARLEQCALSSFDRYLETHGVYYCGENFFTITGRALFNCMVGHAIKVLDRHRKSAAFWAIFDTAPDKITKLSSYKEEKLRFLDGLTGKLKLVRDKTHFHLDEEGILDPRAIWRDADIKRVKLGEGLGYVWEMLRELHLVELGKQFSDPCERYDGRDVVQLLDFACSMGILQLEGLVGSSSTSGG